MADDASKRPRKRRRLLRGCKGVLASDMSLITPSNFSQRSLWRKTPLGRLIRPMRMRPGRPLPLVPAPVSGGQKLALAQKRRRERKGRCGLVRQRRRLIDPELWGSEYLKGVMLESGSGVILPERKAVDIAVPSEPPALEGVDEEDSSLSHPIEKVRRPPSPRLPTPASPHPPKEQKKATITPPAPTLLPPPFTLEPAPENDLAREAAQSLSFLTSLFGNANEESDWGGAESLSDLEVEVSAPSNYRTPLLASGGLNEEGDVEIVPRESASTKATVKTQAPAEIDLQESLEVDDDPGIDAVEAASAPQKSPAVHLTKLKAMFAPREEDGEQFCAASFFIYCLTKYTLSSRVLDSE